MSSKTNEHLVALENGGSVIRVRTVKRRPADDRWNGKAIQEIVASPKAPNPKDKDQVQVLPERLTRGADPGGGDGVDLPEVEAIDQKFLVRDFKITKKIIEKFGMTPGCDGCEGNLTGMRRRHSNVCRRRMEEEMGKDEALEARIHARNKREGRDEPNESVRGQGDEEMPPVPDDGDEELREVEDSEKSKERREEPQPRSRRRVAYDLPDDAEEQSRKRQKVDEAIKYLEKLVSDSGDVNRPTKACNITRQLNAVIRNVEQQHPHDNEGDWWKKLYADVDFLDDVKGFAHLDKDLVIAARKLEIDYFKQMKVYKKVPRSEAIGQKIITTRWIDTNKGDTQKPNYRSRLVGREIKRDKRLDLFAATPPIETLRFLAARCAQQQHGSHPWRMGIIDVRRAYFYAPATRAIYVEIPAEDREAGDEGRVGKLELSLYGTRDAAQNWAIEYTGYMKSIGFVQGAASPCNFLHPKLNLNVTVHGDDFAIAGPLASIQWFQTKMKTKYEIKSEILGPEKCCSDEIRILGRVLRWTRRGIEYEPDQRHAELMVKELGLEKAKPVKTPGTSDDRNRDVITNAEDMEDKEETMRSEEATRYRGLAARLNYLAMDRSDLQQAAKECCKHMSSPMLGDWERLKRVGRYLRGRPRCVQIFRWEKPNQRLEGYADSDWAGDKKSRKSTSGGAVFLRNSLLKSWCSSQNAISLSSGEAELYALTKCACQVTGLQSMAMDFGLLLQGRVHTDSSAAIGIASRSGLGGKARHIQVQYLWIQEKIKSGELDMKKVDTKKNVADLLTKALGTELFEAHVKSMGFIFMDGRAGEAVSID